MITRRQFFKATAARTDSALQHLADALVAVIFIGVDSKVTRWANLTADDDEAVGS